MSVERHSRAEDPHVYAQRRADETGTPYLVSGMGHAMCDLGGNAQLMREALDGIAATYQPRRPRVERTAAGDQHVIADAPRPEMPAGKLRAQRRQTDLRDTPLFGQERAQLERSQTDLFGKEG